jgi:phytoene dehydrogenase-like protein
MSQVIANAFGEDAAPPVVVVGAGMAGLVTAVALHEAGVPVRVFEAADQVGGRIRSHRRDGFVIDHGFHVIFDGYPAARRWVDHEALKPRAFDSAALLWTGRRLVPLANPGRHPVAIVRDLTTRLFTAGEKVRLASLAAEDSTAPWQSANQAAASLGQDVSAAEYLWSRGFSQAFVDRFARPFWGGITLDPNLAGSVGPLLFTMKMLLRGSAVLPEDGVGAMPAQLQARLPDHAVSLDARVTSVVIEDGRATGVRVARRKVPASAVVMATDPLAAAKLTNVQGLAAAGEGVSCVTVFLVGTRDPTTGPRLVLDATRRLLVNHIAPLSAVQPSYAPTGQHLLAAVIIGDAAVSGDVDVLAERAREDVATILGHDRSDWRAIETIRVPYAQFAQPPGIYRRLPGNVTPTRGLVIASEATVDSSYNGAIISGETAAAIVRRELALVVGANAPRD